MKKLISAFLTIMMSFYGVMAMTPVLAYADNGLGHGNGNDHENHGSVVSVVAQNNRGHDGEDKNNDNNSDNNGKDGHGDKRGNKDGHNEQGDENENKSEDAGEHEDNNGNTHASTTIPVISNVAAINIGTSLVTISWGTDILSNSKVFLGTTTPVIIGGVGVTELDSATIVTSHQINLSGLTASTTYYFFVVSANSSGQTSTSTQHSFNTLHVSSPGMPVISNLTASSTGITSEDIVWDTSTSTDSKVYLSAVSPVVIGGIGTSLISSATLLMHHVMNLIGLASGAVYHFIVVSTDSLGNTATSTESSFTTASVALPTYTLAQVATHNTAGNCWTAIGGNVYDLTSYISSHPGGAATISLLCGTDGMALFNAQHSGSSTAIAELATLKIRTLSI